MPLDFRATVSQYSPQYLTRGRETRPRSINFMTQLLFDLGTRDLKIALTMNLESGPRLAGIWL